MEFTIRFYGGPLDGSAIHGDDEKPPENFTDDAPQIYEYTDGGQIGRQFEIINPFTPADEHGTVWEFMRHIYEVFDRHTISPLDAEEKLIIHSRHVRESRR